MYLVDVTFTWSLFSFKHDRSVLFFHSRSPSALKVEVRHCAYSPACVECTGFEVSKAKKHNNPQKERRVGNIPEELSISSSIEEVSHWARLSV